MNSKRTPNPKPNDQPHVIRLRKPWQKQLVGRTDSQRIDVPEPLSEASELTTATYRRSFNCPTGLDSSTKVILVVESWVGDLQQVTLNGDPLDSVSSTAADLRVDITGIIGSHNELELCLGPEDQRPPCLSGSVCLEIFEQ